MSDEDSSEVTVRVLGVGNVLMGDDGLGPYAVRVLESRYEMPDGVEVADAGTPGLDFAPFLAGTESVIVIDTVSSDAAPGSVKLYRREQLLSTPPPARTSPHQPGLRETIMAMELSGARVPEILLIGVVPGSVATGTGLSPAVHAAVDHAVGAAVGELRSLGRAPTVRSEPLPLDIWWE